MVFVIILEDRADELHGKHTLFGRCIGDTIYSGSIQHSISCATTERSFLEPDVMKIGSMGELGSLWSPARLFTPVHPRARQERAAPIVSTCHFLCMYIITDRDDAL